MHLCTYLGDVLICFREHIQSATKDRVFHSHKLGTIVTSQVVEEVLSIEPRLSYIQRIGEVKELP